MKLEHHMRLKAALAGGYVSSSEGHICQSSCHDQISSAHLLQELIEAFMLCFVFVLNSPASILQRISYHPIIRKELEPQFNINKHSRQRATLWIHIMERPTLWIHLMECR